MPVYAAGFKASSFARLVVDECADPVFADMGLVSARSQLLENGLQVFEKWVVQTQFDQIGKARCGGRIHIGDAPGVVDFQGRVGILFGEGGQPAEITWIRSVCSCGDCGHLMPQSSQFVQELVAGFVLVFHSCLENVERRMDRAYRTL